MTDYRDARGDVRSQSDKAAASNRIKAMVAESITPSLRGRGSDMTELAAVLDAWVAHTDFIELVEESSFQRAHRFIAAPRGKGK